jgi:DNA invertase Pin-like site-specific DNA recombinase
MNDTTNKRGASMTNQHSPADDSMPLAISYERVSSMLQLKGDSIRRQSSGAESFAQRHGYRLLKRTYRDYGKSAFKGKNKTEGALGIIRREFEEGIHPRGTLVIVESLDRISREKVGTALEWLLGLIREGAVIGTTIDDKIYNEKAINDPIMLMGSLLYMARANEESETKSIRVKQSWVGRRQKGVKGAVCPSWLYLDTDGQYKPNENRVKIVKEIFDWTIARIGTYTIARMLNNRNEPVWRNVVGKQGKGWHATTVYNILISRAVLGFHQPGVIQDGKKIKIGDEIAGYYPQVINEDVWLRAQAARKRSTAGAKGTKFTNLFDDKAECVHCKGRMNIMHSQIPQGRPDAGKVYRYFVCSNAQDERGCIAEGRWNYDEVENAILDHVPEYKLSEIFASTDEATELKNVEKEIGTAAFKMGELEKRRDRMAREISLTEDEDPLLDLHRKTLREILSDIRKTNDHMNGLRELKAEIEAQQDHRGDAEAVIKQLRADLENESLSDDDKYKLRAKLASALQSFIDFVWFDFEAETFDVVLMGGLIVHKFGKTAPTGRGRARKIKFIESRNVAHAMGDHIVREAFTTMVRNHPIEGEDPDRVDMFNRLVANSK